MKCCEVSSHPIHTQKLLSCRQKQYESFRLHDDDDNTQHVCYNIYTTTMTIGHANKCMRYFHLKYLDIYTPTNSKFISFLLSSAIDTNIKCVNSKVLTLLNVYTDSDDKWHFCIKSVGANKFFCASLSNAVH